MTLVTLAERIALQVALLPPALKELLAAELAAGNAVIEAERGRGEAEGHHYLILEQPFHREAAALPPGTLYRETEGSDRRLFEFAAADAPFSLVHVKFKPMVLPTLPIPVGPPIPIPNPSPVPSPDPAPEPPPEREAEPVPPPPTPTVPGPENAASRFIESMTLTFDRWHDGTGYDLDALRAVPDDEVPALVALLVARRPRDWRDIEALGVLNTPAALQAIQASLNDPDPHVRRYAAAYVGPSEDPEREAMLVKNLKTALFFDGLGAALDEAEEFHPPAVIDALLDGARNREGDIAVNFAAMLCFLHGKSKEAFDWDHRAFFLRFQTADPDERLAVFRELCSMIGVDPAKYQGSASLSDE
jgi:hypothetical protein